MSLAGSPAPGCHGSAKSMFQASALESHGYSPLRQLPSSLSASVLLVTSSGAPAKRFVVKTFALANLEQEGQLGALQEVKLLRKLEHPYVISYVESWWNGAGPKSARLTVVMEHAEDGDLCTPRNAMVGCGGLRIEEALVKRWLRQML